MPLPKSLDRQRRELIKLWLRFRLALIGLVAVLLLAGAGFYLWQQLERGAEQSRQQEVESSARVVASDAQAALDALLEAVDAALDEAAVARLLADADASALREQEARLAAAVPGVLGVRIITPDLDEPDYDAVPPITYASLEMMREAASSGEAPAPEVLLLGEPEEHIAVLRPLAAPDGTVIGHALFGISVDVLTEAVAGARLASGYAELVQTGGAARVVVARKGDVAARQGVPQATLPVRGSSLRVQFWAGQAAAAGAQPAGGPPLLPMAAGLALLVLLAGGAVLLRRRRAGAAPDDGERGSAPAETPTLVRKLAALRRGTRPAATTEREQAPAAAEPAPAAAQPEQAAALPDSGIFRAYDIRGVVGRSLSADVVRRIGLAIGSEAYDRGQQTLCVGCDGRSSSPELLAALIEGLRESGRDVIDVGRVPTPVLYFATYYLETGSGVMITGSHNPPEYNGLKMMLGGDTLFGDDIQALRARIENEEFTTGAGNLQSMDISADYIRRVSEDVPVALGNAFRVVIDCGNGVAGDFAPKLVRALGHDVVELYCEVDGSFPNHHPDPSQPENLADLIAAVKEHDADLGFAFDGDGDRLGVVDPSGRIVWPDAQMMLFARDVLSRNAGAEIVFDVKCSSRLAKVIARLGGKPVMFKTGHSFIKNKLKETGAPLAGEMSGHIFFKERWYGFDDALYAAARMLEILMGFKQKPAEVFAKLPAGVSTPELRVDMEEGENLAFMQSLAGAGGFGDAKVTTIDGVRVDWPDGWGLVRASNTTPSLVLRFEGDDEQALERIQGVFRELLLDRKPDLSLPF